MLIVILDDLKGLPRLLVAWQQAVTLVSLLLANLYLGLRSW